ncbi:hypothetical protein RN001_004723, partial [Aquatica leii]
MADGVNSNASKPYKKCNNIAQNGLKCIKCKSLSHIGFVEVLNNVIKIDDKHIDCCKHNASYQSYWTCDETSLSEHYDYRNEFTDSYMANVVTAKTLLNSLTSNDNHISDNLFLNENAKSRSDSPNLNNSLVHDAVPAHYSSNDKNVFFETHEDKTPEKLTLTRECNPRVYENKMLLSNQSSVVDSNYDIENSPTSPISYGLQVTNKVFMTKDMKTRIVGNASLAVLEKKSCVIDIYLDLHFSNPHDFKSSHCLTCDVVPKRYDDDEIHVFIPSKTYTRNVVEYELVVPSKLDSNQRFKTYIVPHLCERDIKQKPIPRHSELYYLITFNGAHNYVDLWPNHSLLSTDAVFESRDAKEAVKSRRLKRKDGNLCYYHGRIRDKPGSRVALSTCYGLAGYIILDGRRYFIEPVAEYEPNSKGQQPHLIYQTDNKQKLNFEGNCGTSANWQKAWKNRLFEEFIDHPFHSRSTLISVPRYLETLVVADKQFLNHHKHTDYDSYVMTIMNM